MKYILTTFLLLTQLYSSIIIDEAFSKKDSFDVAYLYDVNSALGIKDIQSLHFPKVVSNKFTFGYLQGTTWFKFNIENKSDKEYLILSFTEALWKNIDLYYKEDNTWKVSLNGLDIPLNERSISDVKPTFHLKIDPKSSKIFYIKARTISSQVGSFEILSLKEYYNPSKIDLTDIYIIFAFIILIVTLLNIFNFILTKETVYLYYIAYMIVAIIFSSMQSGSYLMLGFSGWNEGLHFTGAVLLIFLLLFADKFLDLEIELPSFHQFFKYTFFLLLIFCIVIFYDLPYATLTFNIFSIFIFIMLFISVLKMYIKSYRGVGFYLLSLLIYASLMGVMVSVFNTFLDYSTLTRHAFLAGMLIEIIFFTLILSSKYRTIKLEKIQMQEALIQEQSQHQDILKKEISLAIEENAKKDKQLFAQSRLAQMGELISMVAHQWRQPLASIASLSIHLQVKSQLASSDLSTKELGDERESTNENLKKIDDLVQHLTSTIDDFKDFYKPNKIMVLVSLEDIINKTLKIIESSLISSNIEIRKEFTSSQHIEVYANELMQVILNILKNAQDIFLSNKVSKPIITIKTLDRSLYIIDNGGGIAENILDKIFDPYFSTKNDKNGSGLGLYMSKIIIEKHHKGVLEVKNTGSGVCFEIRL